MFYLVQVVYGFGILKLWEISSIMVGVSDQRFKSQLTMFSLIVTGTRFTKLRGLILEQDRVCRC